MYQQLLRKISFLLIAFSLFHVAFAANTGRFYGRIIDAKTGKGVEAASVQIWQDGYDEATHEAKPLLKAGQLTEPNGDFALENVPIYGFMKLKITAIGYEPMEKKVSFEVILDKKRGPEINMGTYDKDLGDIKLTPQNVELDAVKIKAEEPFMKTRVDRKIYNADKLATAAGGSAKEVLQNVPGVKVDLDGKVTVRNASPQIYVDGKPTNLSLEQIPSNTIQSIEVINNPSAKYDASGSGGGGIINIVLKKERRMGYNSNLLFGIDRRGRIISSADISIRRKKMNVFAGAGLFQRKSIAVGYANRENLYQGPLNNIYQDTRNVQNNLFGNFYGGIDWFINNRNTITITQSYNSGGFGTNDKIAIKYDSQLNVPKFSFANRGSESARNFSNLGSSLQYKKLFPKNGRELTSDVFYNAATSTFNTNTTTDFKDEAGNTIKDNVRQKQEGSGGVAFFIAQVDYEDPLTNKSKLEAGLRTQMSSFYSHGFNGIYNHSTGQYDKIQSQQNNYKYNDRIDAAYTTYSREYKKFSYQAGLRAESYIYNGSLTDQGKTFRNYYPISLFPSVFLTYKVNDDHDFQLNMSRRVQRPNFFQLIPYLDFSDSLNLSRGNPGLKPEFSYLAEFSYNYVWERNRSFMANIYFRTATNLITTIQTAEWTPELNRNVIISTYANANSAMAYGLELDYQNIYKKKLEYNLNVNVYGSQIVVDPTKVQSTNMKGYSMFNKLNVRYKFSKQFIIQMLADYQSKVSLQPDGSGGGPFNFGGGASSSSQGYQRQTGGLDLAIRYDFDIKKVTDEKKRKDPTRTRPATLVLNFSDILHTRRYDMYSASSFYVQNTFRQRDWQMVRVTFTYRFGKFDTFLFRRKSSNKNSGVQIL